MDKTKLEQLLKQIPEIAKAVNEFKSEELQRRAFETLVQAAGVIPSSTPSPDTTSAGASSKNQKPTSKPETDRGRRRTGGDTYSILELDLRPKGKMSLRDFMKQKNPTSDPEKYACMIYYLDKHLGINKVTPDHIFTCFKEIAEKVPNIRQGLINTYHRHGWITKTGKSDISLSRVGTNLVEHDLPKAGAQPARDDQ